MVHFTWRVSGFAAQEPSLLTGLNQYSVTCVHLPPLPNLKGPYPGQFELTVIFLHILNTCLSRSEILFYLDFSNGWQKNGKT